MNDQLQRAYVLVAHGRHDQALEQIAQLLAMDPEEPVLHHLASECHLAARRFDQAEEHARTGRGLAPNDAWPDISLARSALLQNRPKIGLRHAEAARSLEPDDPQIRALIGQSHLLNKHYDQAVRAAESGLRIDPDHEGCLSVRAHALLALGRHDEAASDIARNLELDPDDSDNHVAAGFQALHRGDHRRARTAFLEALHLDPNSEAARQGLIESLKSSNLFYRHFLRLVLWVQDLPTQTAMILLIASVFVRRSAMSAAESAPALVIPANLLVWGIFGLFIALMIAMPLCNLVLFLHPLGRHALSRGERRQALFLGAGALLALGSLWPVFQGWVQASNLAIGALLAMVPLAYATMERLLPWSRATLLTITVLAYGIWGWSVHSEYQRQRFLGSNADTISLMRSMADTPPVDIPPEVQERIRQFHHDGERVKSAVEHSHILFGILLWGLVIFTWVGGFLIKFRN